jgi:hypothetical protein
MEIYIVIFIELNLLVKAEANLIVDCHDLHDLHHLDFYPIFFNISTFIIINSLFLNYFYY